MTRAVVFLAAAMVAASLGVVAQDASGGGTHSTPQNNPNNNPQHTVTVAATPQPSASGQGTATSAGAPATQDSAKSATTRDHNANEQNPAQGDESTIATNGQLPQTSTILPLLGLIGLGSLVAGFFARH
jgi:hypothetical protein